MDIAQRVEPHKILCVPYCLFLCSSYYDGFDA